MKKQKQWNLFYMKQKWKKKKQESKKKIIIMLGNMSVKKIWDKSIKDIMGKF